MFRFIHYWNAREWRNTILYQNYIPLESHNNWMLQQEGIQMDLKEKVNRGQAAYPISVVRVAEARQWRG